PEVSFSYPVRMSINPIIIRTAAIPQSESNRGNLFILCLSRRSAHSETQIEHLSLSIKRDGLLCGCLITLAPTYLLVKPGLICLARNPLGEPSHFQRVDGPRNGFGIHIENH